MRTGSPGTVKIRDDVRFTDGEPLTAEDVAFTYNTLKDTSSVNDFTMLKEAVAVDDTTVEFHMNRPYSIWPYTMAITGIVPEHAYGPDYGQKPIGSGRYILKQWDKGQQVIFEANPDYYGEAPRMKKVTVLFMEEDAAYAAAHVRPGGSGLHFGGLLGPDHGRLISCFPVRRWTTGALIFRLCRPGRPMKTEFPLEMISPVDVRVRRAINLAIDRQAMIDHVLNGHGTTAYSVCDKMPWYSKDSEAALRSPRRRSGFWMKPDGRQERTGSGKRMERRLDSQCFTPQEIRSARPFQRIRPTSWQRLGIHVTVEGVGWDTAYDRAQSEPLMWGWGAHTPMELYNIYHTRPGGKYAAVFSLFQRGRGRLYGRGPGLYGSGGLL